MKVTPLSFYELARTSHIKRWHIVNTANQQNLAEHQYNVSVIGLELHKRIRQEPPSAAFIIAMLFHDSAEIRYGDVPTPGKAFIKSFSKNDALFDEMDDCIIPEFLYADGSVGAQESEIIKMADLIEAAHWIRENGMGAHAGVVADKCRRSMEEKVHTAGWYEYVNPVLADLGMPHVNRNERLTPP